MLKNVTFLLLFVCYCLFVIVCYCYVHESCVFECLIWSGVKGGVFWKNTVFDSMCLGVSGGVGMWLSSGSSMFSDSCGMVVCMLFAMELD